MTKIDYKTLDTEDLLSLASKICIAVPKHGKPMDVDSAYDMISTEIDRILEKEKDSDKSADPYLTADQLKKELQRRYDEGWGLIEKKAEDEEQVKSGDYQNRYFIYLTVNDNQFRGNCGAVNKCFYYSRNGEKKDIPDIQLLKDRSFEWLAKYLKSSVYKEEDPSVEPYDEGFDE